MSSDKIFALCLLAICYASASPARIDPRADIITDPHIRLQEAVRAVRQLNNNVPIQEAVRGNLLDSLSKMAMASQIAGTNVSRAAATVIRGFVQDSFNIGSIGAYIPRLIFLDGPNQFIETMKLVRTGNIRVPMDMDSAIDTLINFAGSVRDSPVTMNTLNPFTQFFPNIFRGAETLVGETLLNVFAWLSPVQPGDISPGSLGTYLNRWDSQTSTRRPNEKIL